GTKSKGSPRTYCRSRVHDGVQPHQSRFSGTSPPVRHHLPRQNALYGPAKWLRLYWEDKGRGISGAHATTAVRLSHLSMSTHKNTGTMAQQSERGRSGEGLGGGSGIRIVRARGSSRSLQSWKKRRREGAPSMDEETQRSMGEGDLKVQKSIKTVKVALAGNLAITLAKFLSYWHSGSSAMLSEAVHSLVDSGNQALLLVGLHTASTAPDKRHQYGYGKSVYFWSLISALGTFWMGAGISLRHSIQDLLHPTMLVHKVSWETWGVLGFGFVVDGYVLVRTLREFMKTCPEGRPLIQHIKMASKWGRKVRDPTTLAVLLEDGGACAGIIIAIAGIGQMYGSPVYDSVAGVCVACLLATMGAILTKVGGSELV
ncbi:unnamed protein product, partial [Choristocarpus tenellus]